MTPANTARLADMLNRFDDLAAKAEQLKQRTSKATATAESADREVAVTVGYGGVVKEVRFDPKAYRRLSPEAMAECVATAATAATRALEDRVSDAHRQLYGEHFDLTKLNDGRADLADTITRTSAKWFGG